MGREPNAEGHAGFISPSLDYAAGYDWQLLCVEMRAVKHCLRDWLCDPTVRWTLFLYLSARVGLSLWGALALALIPRTCAFRIPWRARGGI